MPKWTPITFDIYFEFPVVTLYCNGISFSLFFFWGGGGVRLWEGAGALYFPKY